MEKEVRKKIYEPPRAELIYIDSSDVIATSGPLTNDDGENYDPNSWV